MKKALIWIFIIVVIVAVVATRVMKRGDETPARSIEDIHASEGVPVDVVTVRERTITIEREVSGEVAGIRQSTLRASGDYKIAEVIVHEGDRVKRGQTLARYDVGVAPDFMALYKQANEAYQNAKRQVDRLEPLFEEGAIAESDLDAAQTQLAIARADLRNARLELEVISPLDGVVTLIAVRAGDALEGGDVVAQVAILDSVRVVADVSGETVRELKTGAHVALDNPAGAGSGAGSNTGGSTARAGETNSRDSGNAPGGLVGRLTRVSLGANPDTRLFRVEAIVENNDMTLRPGMVVTMDVLVDRVGPVPVLPRTAILSDKALIPGSSHDVYTIADGVAHLGSVVVGQSTEALAEIRSGITSGERVVVFGANRLTDGAKAKFHKIDGKLVETAGDGGAAGANARGETGSDTDAGEEAE